MSLRYSVPQNSRLNAVLRVGAKGRDENGNEFKWVEFKHDDPKSASIQRNCVGVPWKKYAPKSVPLEEYATDVTADPRLKNIGLGSPFDTAVSATQSAAVQAHARAMLNSMVINPFPYSANVLWAIEFNSEHDDFARYCLVPVNARSIEERLSKAVRHMESYVSDEALGIYDKTLHGIVQFRDYYVRHWTRALIALKTN